MCSCRLHPNHLSTKMFDDDRALARLLLSYRARAIIMPSVGRPSFSVHGRPDSSTPAIISELEDVFQRRRQRQQQGAGTDSDSTNDSAIEFIKEVGKHKAFAQLHNNLSCTQLQENFTNVATELVSEIAPMLSASTLSTSTPTRLDYLSDKHVPDEAPMSEAEDAEFVPDEAPISQAKHPEVVSSRDSNEDIMSGPMEKESPGRTQRLITDDFKDLDTDQIKTKIDEMTKNIRQKIAEAKSRMGETETRSVDNDGAKVIERAANSALMALNSQELNSQQLSVSSLLSIKNNRTLALCATLSCLAALIMLTCRATPAPAPLERNNYSALFVIFMVSLISKILTHF